MTKTWSLLAIVAIASVTRHAEAQSEPPLELVWDAPAGCPDKAFVRQRIERTLLAPVGLPIVATAKVERGSAAGVLHLTLRVQIGDVEEVRSIDAASCSALAEAFAVVVGLAIDSAKESARTHDQFSVKEHEHAPPTPIPLTATPPRVIAPSPIESRSRSASRPSLVFGLGGFVDSGPLPAASGGMLGSVSLRLRQFRFGVLGALAFRQSAYFAGPAGATFDRIEGGAFGCYVVPIGAVAVGPCANVEATHVRARSFGIRSPGTSSATWWTPVLGARFELSIRRRLGVFVRGDVLYPIQPPTFSLATRDDGLVVHDPAGLHVRMSFGVEIAVP